MRQPAPSKACGGQWWRPPVLLLVLLALLPLSSGQGGGKTSPGATAPLVPFHSVSSCLPFSLHIRPSGSIAATDGSRAAAQDGAEANSSSAPARPAYSLRLDATDANVTGAFEYTVTPDGTLHLSLSTPVATNSCTSVVVELPANALREVRATVVHPVAFDPYGSAAAETDPDVTSSPAVVIEGPFNLPSLTAGLVYGGPGNPRLIVRGATVDILTLAAGRCTCATTLFASGTFRDVRVHAGNSDCPGQNSRECTLVTCQQPAAQVALVTERIAVDGSVSLTTPNASLLIEGTAGPVVISNAGLCNLRLPSDTAWLPVQPCRITGEPPPAQAGEAAAAVVAQQAGAFNQTCFVNTTSNGSDECDANNNSTQFDQRSGLGAASVAMVPLPGPLAEEVVGKLLVQAHHLAAQAAAGNATAAEALVDLISNDVDALALFSEIAFSEGGHEGALAACEAVNWGCSTTYGCRNSFQRALALLINHNDTAGLRNALETGAEWEQADATDKGKLSDSWPLGTVWNLCPADQCCTADFGGVRAPNATALMLAAGLTLAGGYFREAAAEAARVIFVCNQDPISGCKQVRAALGNAVELAPRLGYGSGQDVMNNAMAVADPGWRACVFGQAFPPAPEGQAVGCGA